MWITGSPGVSPLDRQEPTFRPALTAAKEIYEKKKKQTGEEAQADGDQKPRRAYLHNSKGPDRPGCECWHLTSDTD